jgi:hypothetical protein
VSRRPWTRASTGDRLVAAVLVVVVVLAGLVVWRAAQEEEDEPAPAARAADAAEACEAIRKSASGTCRTGVRVDVSDDGGPALLGDTSVRILRAGRSGDEITLMLRVRNVGASARTLAPDRGQFVLRSGEQRFRPAPFDTVQLAPLTGTTVALAFDVGENAQRVLDGEAAAALEVVPFGELDQLVPRRLGVVALPAVPTT